MKLNDFLAGLEILAKHFDDPADYHIGSEHDQFYVYATDSPLSEGAVKHLKSLGWFQPDVPDGAPYDGAEGWSAWI
jgi:hypothetical protein